MCGGGRHHLLFRGRDVENSVEWRTLRYLRATGVGKEVENSICSLFVTLLCAGNSIPPLFHTRRKKASSNSCELCAACNYGSCSSPCSLRRESTFLLLFWLWCKGCSNSVMTLSSLQMRRSLLLREMPHSHTAVCRCQTLDDKHFKSKFLVFM